MKKVLVTGGAGYVGCVLIPKLLHQDYEVTVYDLMIFGDEGLPQHENLKVVKGDLRDIELFNGRFDDEKMAVLSKTFIDIPDTDEVFLCGPEKMVEFVSNYLVEAGLPKDLIHFELFVKGLSDEDIARQERLAKQNVEGTEVVIVDGGKEFEFTMTKEYDNILDAALGAGADLPFACKGGVAEEGIAATGVKVTPEVIGNNGFWITEPGILANHEGSGEQ